MQQRSIPNTLSHHQWAKIVNIIKHYIKHLTTECYSECHAIFITKIGIYIPLLDKNTQLCYAFVNQFGKIKL